MLSWCLNSPPLLFSFVIFQIVKQLFQLLPVYMWEEPLEERKRQEKVPKDAEVMNT